MLICAGQNGELRCGYVYLRRKQGTVEAWRGNERQTLLRGCWFAGAHSQSSRLVAAALQSTRPEVPSEPAAPCALARNLHTIIMNIMVKLWFGHLAQPWPSPHSDYCSSAAALPRQSPSAARISSHPYSFPHLLELAKASPNNPLLSKA